MDGIDIYRVGEKTVRVISDHNVFSRFRKRWDAALRDCPTASIYISHQWLDALWSAYADEIYGRVVWIDDAKGPCALAPMMGMRYRYRGLSIPAVGSIDHGHISRSDVALIRDQVECVDILLDHTKRWGASLWRLDRLSANSELYQLMTSEWDIARRLEHYESPDLAVVDTSASWQEYMERKSANFRRDCRKIQSDLEGLEMITVVEPDRLMETLGIAAAQNWLGHDGDAFELDAKRSRFLGDVTSGAAADGTLRAVVALDRGDPVGVSFGISYNGTLYTMATAFDRRYEARSVGTGTMAEMIWMAFEDPDVRRCDLGAILSPADERRRWATRLDQMINALVMNGGIGSAAIRAGRTLGGLKKALSISRAEPRPDWDDEAA